MMQMEERTLLAFLHDAYEQAIQKGSEQLISWTKKIAPISIIDVFKRTEASEENRHFWTNSDRDFALFGYGSLIELVAENNRFETIKNKWNRLVEKTMIYNQYAEEGTGLTALGGMSFDPLAKKSELWKNYPTAQLTIPKYVITFVNEQYFLTINQRITSDDDVASVMDEIERVEESLLKGALYNESDRQQITERIEKDPIGWKESVQKAVDTISSEEAEKIVLARELRLKLAKDLNVSAFIEKMMEVHDQSYIFAYEQGDDCFLGASPERLIQLQGDKMLSTCLAGTAPRGKDLAEDRLIAETELMNNPKNREEHDHVVQMIRSSIAAFCHDINIPEAPVILTLRNLQHLYTPVRAKLNDGVSVFDLIEVLHPTPALGGVPTSKALAFIRNEEQFERGWYGAPIGWLDAASNSEFAVAIRSALIQKDEMSLFAGCGVMADSDPEKEYEETAVKFLPILTILEELE